MKRDSGLRPQIDQAAMSTPAAENGPEDVNNRSFWMVSEEFCPNTSGGVAAYKNASRNTENTRERRASAD